VDGAAGQVKGGKKTKKIYVAYKEKGRRKIADRAGLH